jgi:hypothetical protein
MKLWPICSAKSESLLRTKCYHRSDMSRAIIGFSENNLSRSMVPYRPSMLINPSLIRIIDVSHPFVKISYYC